MPTYIQQTHNSVSACLSANHEQHFADNYKQEYYVTWYLKHWRKIPSMHFQKAEIYLSYVIYYKVQKRQHRNTKQYWFIAHQYHTWNECHDCEHANHVGKSKLLLLLGLKAKISGQEFHLQLNFTDACLKYFGIGILQIIILVQYCTCFE